MPARINRKPGDRHGRLVLICEKEPDGWGGRQFLFKCDCGNEVTVRWGITASCGCLQREMTKHKTNYAKRLRYGEACFNFVYSRYVRSARAKKRTFLLTKDQFKDLTSRPCHYCGTAPTCIETKYNDAYGEYTYNGLDRVDPKAGYTMENVVPCCRDCNIAKHTMTEERFFSWLKRAYTHTFIYAPYCIQRPSSNRKR